MDDLTLHGRVQKRLDILQSPKYLLPGYLNFKNLPEKYSLGVIRLALYK